MKLTVDVPCTIYRVDVGRNGRVDFRNLSGNARKSAIYSDSPVRRRLDRKAQALVREWFWLATKEALQRTERHQSSTIQGEVVVHVSPTVFRARAVRADGDGWETGMKEAFDGVASALGVDDECFQVGHPVFRKGPDRTVLDIEITEA